MKPHEYFIANVAYPVSMTLAMLPIAVCVLALGRSTAPALRSSSLELKPAASHKPSLWDRVLSYASRDFAAFQLLPARGFAAVALCAATQNLLVSLPAPYLGGALQVVLGTVSVPATMAVSIAWLRVRYSWTHVAGGALVVAGIVLSVWRDLSAGPSTVAPDASHYQWLWVVTFLAGYAIPVGVVEERWLKHSGLGVVVFRGCYAPLEVASAVVLLPTLFLPLPGRRDDTSLSSASDFVAWMRSGWLCFWGHASADSLGDCAGTAPLFAAFVVVNIVWVLAGLAIAQHVSGAALALVTAVSIPVTTITFQWAALAGPAVQHSLSWWTVASMGVAACGFMLYRWREERHEPTAGSTEERVALLPNPPGDSA